MCTIKNKVPEQLTRTIEQHKYNIKICSSKMNVNLWSYIKQKNPIGRPNDKPDVISGELIHYYLLLMHKSTPALINNYYLF